MNLCRLELMKIRLSTYLCAILGIFVGILSLGILFLLIFQIERGSGTPDEAELFANWNGLLALTTALAFACFSILSAVIAAKVIISEYCGKNAVILLSYPVNRKAMLGTKYLIVSGITTVYLPQLASFLLLLDGKTFVSCNSHMFPDYCMCFG